MNSEFVTAVVDGGVLYSLYAMLLSVFLFCMICYLFIDVILQQN